jgi:hypothetical protein
VAPFTFSWKLESQHAEVSACEFSVPLENQETPGIFVSSLVGKMFVEEKTHQPSEFDVLCWRTQNGAADSSLKSVMGTDPSLSATSHQGEENAPLQE